MGDKVRLRTRQRRYGDVVMVAVEGFIQATEARLLERELVEAKKNAKAVILDMRGVEYISSSGIGMLLNLTKRWEESEGKPCFAIYGLKERHTHVLETLGIAKLFKVGKTRSEAFEILGLEPPTVPSLYMGVVSDSHGNTELLRRVALHMVKEHAVTTIVHLGDEHSDAEVLADLDAEIISVPGVFHPDYRNPEIANRIIRPFCGWVFMLSHTDTPHQNDLMDDPDPEEAVNYHKVDVLLFGHTHVPVIEVRNGVLCVNPGNLKEDDKKHGPTYAILRINEDEIEATIYDALSNAAVSSLTHRR